MENNTLSLLVDATQSLEYIVFDVNRRFSQQVKTLIKVMQEYVGYIAFNDESGFPEFHDYSLDHTNQIMAIRYNEDKELIEIMTDDNFDETFEDGWFNPIIYGTYDDHNLFDSLKSVIAKN